MMFAKLWKCCEICGIFLDMNCSCICRDPVPLIWERQVIDIDFKTQGPLDAIFFVICCYLCNGIQITFTFLQISQFRSELNGFHSFQVCESLLPSSGVMDPSFGFFFLNKLEPINFVYYFLILPQPPNVAYNHLCLLWKCNFLFNCHTKLWFSCAAHTEHHNGDYILVNRNTILWMLSG